MTVSLAEIREARRARTQTVYEYDVSDSADFAFDAVMRACSTEAGAVAWAKSVGLLADPLLCPICSNPMRYKEDTAAERPRWRCNRSGCRIERGIRVNSFFSRSSTRLSVLIKLLLFWAYQHPVTTAAEQVGVDPGTATQWYAYAQDICTAEMKLCDMKIGGVGHVVEIDETSLKTKSKYRRGIQHPDFWVFGGVDRTTKKWLAKVVYDDRTKLSLSMCIKRYIKPRTLIMSDMFKSYVTIVTRGRNKGKVYSLKNNHYLKDMRYGHLWVNHKKNFRCPKTGAHTNRIEGLWEVKIKQRIKAARGMKKTMVAAYLDECLWRSWYFAPQATKADYFCGLVRGIRKH